MKKIIRCVIIVFCCCICLSFVYYKTNRIKGTIEVVINGEEYYFNELYCIYESNQKKDEDISYNRNKEIINFKNAGKGYGKYIYSFKVKTEELDLTPQFVYFKANRWSFDNLHLKMVVTGKGEDWTVDMIMKDENDDTVEKHVDLLLNNDVTIQMGP